MIVHPEKQLSMNGHSGGEKTELTQRLIATMVANFENLPVGLTISDGPW